MPRTPPPSAPPHIQEDRLPWGTITLPDGRTLRFVGALLPALRTPQMVDSGQWMTSDGLRVIATVERYGDRYHRHMSLSYADHLPSDDEMRAVQQRFFAAHHGVERLAPHQHAANDLDPHYVHLVQQIAPPPHLVNAA